MVVATLMENDPETGERLDLHGHLFQGSLSDPADAAHEVDPFVPAGIANAQNGVQQVVLQDGNVQRGNGIFLGFVGLTIEMALFLPLAVSVVAGDAIAGEANQGTLRYLLIAPVSRLRLLLVKATSLAIGAITAATVVAISGLITGTLLFGALPLTTISGTTIGVADGLFRLLIAVLYLAAGLTALAMIGLFISTLTEQPIAATVATVQAHS